METFSRIDIFDTKGAEYLFVIGYLLILLIFWKLANKQININKQIHNTLQNLSASILKIPQGLFFSKNHTWTHLDEFGTAKVGLDDLLQHLTGGVVFNNLKKPGEFIKKGELLSEIEQNGKFLEVFSPISGKIIKTNTSLIKKPELLNESPYIKAWIYKIKPQNWVEETSSYYFADDAKVWSEKELTRFKDFLATSSMKQYSSDPSAIILQDGGELCEHVLKELPQEVWTEFQEQFLDN